jgi:hypothetical protein
LDRVRHSVRCVIPCDVLQSDPLLGHTESPFDIIISVFCLECAVSSPKEYPSTVSNVVRLLNPSGHLIMMVNITWYIIQSIHLSNISFIHTQGGLEGEHYFIRDRKIPRIKLTREMINLALQNAGCEIITWHELPRNLRPPELPIDYTAMFFCVAKKICWWEILLTENPWVPSGNFPLYLQGNRRCWEIKLFSEYNDTVFNFSNMTKTYRNKSVMFLEGFDREM